MLCCLRNIALGRNVHPRSQLHQLAASGEGQPPPPGHSHARHEDPLLRGRGTGPAWSPPGRAGMGKDSSHYFTVCLCSPQDRGGTLKALMSTMCRWEAPRDFFSHKHPEVLIYKPRYAIKTNRLDASEHHNFYANATKASLGMLMVRAQRGKGP